MPTMFDRQGQAVEVPAEQAQQAYLSGQLAFGPGARVDVVDPNGDSYHVDPSELSAMPEGWSVESDESIQRRKLESEYGGLAQQALTVGEHALSGATVGLADPILGAVGGEEYKRKRANREVVNPGLAIGGEVAGAVAPLLLSGGTSAPGSVGALGRLGSAARAVGAPTRAVSALGRGAEALTVGGLGRLGVTGESIAGRALLTGAKYGVGGAVEGALQGAGHALSETALAPGGNYDRLSERILAGAKDGAIFGGITGGAMGATGGALAGAAKKLVGADGLKRMLTDFADERTIKALGARGSDIKKLGRTAEGAEDAIHRMARDVREATLEDGTRVFNALDKAEDLASKVERAKDEIGQRLGALRKEVADSVVDAKPMLARIEADVLAPLRAADSPDIVRKAAKVERQFAKLRASMDAGDPITLDRLEKVKQNITDLIWPNRNAKVGLQSPAPAHADQLLQARGILEETIEDATAKALPADRAGLYTELKSKYRSYKQASDIAGAASLQDLGNRMFSPTDYITGGLVTAGTIATGGVGALVGLAKGAAVSLAHKQVRERSSSVLAVLADRLAKSDATISKSVQRFFNIGSAVRRRAPALAVANDPHRKKRQSSVDAALGRRKNETRYDAYRRRIKEIDDRLASPVQFAESRVGFAGEHAPATAAAAASVLTRGAEFLKSKVPPPPASQAVSLQPHVADVPPDPGTVAKFARYLQAVDRPLSTLDELENGTLTREHVEALRAVYPHLYEDIRTKVQDELAGTKEPVPYSKRVQLGILLDLPTDPSLRPVSIRLTQQTFGAPAQGQGPDQGPAETPKPTTDTAQSFETEAQKIASGHEEF